MYTAAAEPTKRRAATRFARTTLLTGSVLRAWGAVRDALARFEKPADRRIRVMRVVTTDEEARKLIGIWVPEPVVPNVVAKLEEMAREEDAAAAAAKVPALAVKGEGVGKREAAAMHGAMPLPRDPAHSAHVAVKSDVPGS